MVCWALSQKAQRVGLGMEKDRNDVQIHISAACLPALSYAILIHIHYPHKFHFKLPLTFWCSIFKPSPSTNRVRFIHPTGLFTSGCLRQSYERCWVVWRRERKREKGRKRKRERERERERTTSVELMKTCRVEQLWPLLALRLVLREKPRAEQAAATCEHWGVRNGAWFKRWVLLLSIPFN